MFVEVSPHRIINTDEIVYLAIYPDSKDEYTRRRLFIMLKGNHERVDFLYETIRECRKMYNYLRELITRDNFVKYEEIV